MAAVPSRMTWCEERCSFWGMWKQRPSPDQQQRKLPGQALGTAVICNLTQACKSKATSSSSGTQRSCEDVQCFLKIKNPCSFIEINYIVWVCGSFSVESMWFSTSQSCAAVRTMILKYCYCMDTGTLFPFLVTRHSPDYLCPGQLLPDFSPPRICYFDIDVMWIQLSTNMAFCVWLLSCHMFPNSGCVATFFSLFLT